MAQRVLVTGGAGFIGSHVALIVDAGPSALTRAIRFFPRRAETHASTGDGVAGTNSCLASRSSSAARSANGMAL